MKSTISEVRLQVSWFKCLIFNAIFLLVIIAFPSFMAGTPAVKVATISHPNLRMVLEYSDKASITSFVMNGKKVVDRYGTWQLLMVYFILVKTKC